jgi:hypothetical protein
METSGKIWTAQDCEPDRLDREQEKLDRRAVE